MSRPPDPNAPICSECEKPMRRNGKTAAGKQRWCCTPPCKVKFVEGGGDHGGHRRGRKGGTPVKERIVKSRRKKSQKSLDMKQSSVIIIRHGDLEEMEMDAMTQIEIEKALGIEPGKGLGRLEKLEVRHLTALISACCVEIEKKK